MRIASTSTNKTTTNPTVVARESSELPPPVPSECSVAEVGSCPSGVCWGTCAPNVSREREKGEGGG